MFNKQNFCHIASNNRNEVKVGVFVYKTTDNLQTVLQSGYFNEKIVDINLHDLIIHEQTNAADKTIVERNLLCVVERTLENVGTQVIQSNWEKTIDETIADIEAEIESLDNKFVLKTGDTMTGPLTLNTETTGSGDAVGIIIRPSMGGNDSRIENIISAFYSGGFNFSKGAQFYGNVRPALTNSYDLGGNAKWRALFVTKINNGGDLEVPAVSGTIATKADVDLAANSGDQLTNKGVWYAKMYATTVAPSAEDGTNYADFSQTDGQGNPIIVLYERQNGAWAQTDTITPPADYNGYVTVTSKIWDIPEQAGQQGGKVLWSHNQKTFTPYPQIISFEDAALTGNSTVQMPAQPTGNSIVNVDYLSTHSGGTGKNVGDIFFTTRTDNGLSGAVECDGATYNTTDFVGSGNIGGLLADGKVPYVSLADYATALATDGVCGVYGWDGAGTTAFRVPSLNDIFVETGTAAQIGEYIEPSIPNLKCSIGESAAWRNSGALAVINSGDGFAQSLGNASGKDVDGASDTRPYGFSLNASRVSSVYKDGATTVQPNAVRYRAMVQLATGATDEALETCTSVLADVAGLKSHEVIAFQAPTADNNYTWYRKYADGWVEQGGRNNGVNDTGTNTLSIEMANTSYSVQITRLVLTTADDPAAVSIQARNLTTTSFQGRQTYATANSGGLGSGSSYAYVWEVKGMAAN